MLVLAESAGDVLDQAWSAATGSQAAPPQATVVLTGLAALAVILWPAAWRVARHAVTMAHEGAHAFAALLTGRRLRGVTLHTDASGLAKSIGKGRGPGLMLVAFVGYPGPGLLGLGAAALLHAQHAMAVLWIAVVLSALLLLQIRNLWGLVVVLAAGAAVLAVSWWAAPVAQSAVAYGLTWFLLLAAPRTVIELARAQRAGATGTDAQVLARLTHLPTGVWTFLFFATTLGCLIAGASLLLP